MGETPDYHGATSDFWDGVRASIDQNNAEIVTLQLQTNVAQGAGALMLANA